MNRKTFLKQSGLMMLGGLGMISGMPAMAAKGQTENTAAADDKNPRNDFDKAFPIYDLHVHRSDKQDGETIVKKARQAGLKCVGIMENIAPWGIRTDKDLQKYYREVRPLGCLVGLQPVAPGWTRNLSRELIDRADYILMDPQYMVNGNRYGDTLEVWDHNCYVPDEEAFMKRNMEYYLEILEGSEPLDILGWPLLLPFCIERDYYRLWTHERMERIIDACRARNIKIEINDLAHTPHAEFILMARNKGIKFTFGSDTRDHRSFRLDYCKNIATLCRLTADDFWIPKHKQS